MKNGLIEKGAVIIHSVAGKYQWIYRADDPDETKTGFEAGKFRPITGKSIFDSREAAIEDVRKYIKEHHLKEPSVIY